MHKVEPGGWDMDESTTVGPYEDMRKKPAPSKKAPSLSDTRHPAPAPKRRS